MKTPDDNVRHFEYKHNNKLSNYRQVLLLMRQTKLTLTNLTNAPYIIKEYKYFMIYIREPIQKNEI